MRIRKHAKLAGLSLSTAAATSSDLSPQPPLRLQSRICHLNQSPWDIICFPPDSASSPYQVDGEDCFTPNGSFGDSIGAVESDASMKITVDGDENNVNNDTLKRVVSIDEKIEEMENLEEREGELLCCKTDGKGWQCKEKSSRGHSLCDHHLAQLRKYNNLAHPSTKKLEKPVEKAAAIRRRPRNNKPMAASNPYEFYYYSGFGPRWGKKRGTRGEPSTINNANDKCDRVKEIVSDRVIPSPSCQINYEKFDYVEDDDDDEENGEESGESGKKRTRKPIKARSLKSLM